MSDARAALDALFSRPDRNEWTDSDAAEVLETAVKSVLDLCDGLDSQEPYGKTHPIADAFRTAVQDALTKRK